MSADPLQDEIGRLLSASSGDIPSAWPRLPLTRYLTEPPPEPDWFLEGFLEHGELAWVAGPGKAGKSITALFLLNAALAGAPTFLGCGLDRLDWALIIDGENREATVRRRVHLAGMTPDVADRIDYRSVRGADLGSPDGLGELARLVNRPGRGLVVFDSLIALHRADEDKAGEVRRFVTGLRSVLEPAGVTAIGIAHENRGGNMRGSLDWRNAADTVLELRKDEDGWRTLKVGDRRDGPEDIPPRVFRFVERDGRLLLETTGDATRRPSGRPPTRREVLVEQIIRARSADGVLARAEIARQLGITPDHGTFKTAWKEAEARMGQGQELPGRDVARGLRAEMAPPLIGGAFLAPLPDEPAGSLE